MAGEVRLTLPPTLKAEPAAQKVTLAVGAEADCTFKVRLDAQAGVGVHTVVAGLYAGDQLVSTDFATRVLTVPPPPKDAKK